MAMIVGVHGAFHQYWGPNQLRSRWLPALRDGLAHHGASVRRRDVTIGFYGDIFRPDVMHGRPTDDEIKAIAVHSGLMDLIEDRFGHDGYQLLAHELGQEHLKQLINQLGRYFDDPMVRRRVRTRVESVIGPETRVVVAHSMGTVVAYEALVANPQWQVDTFVTLGSPLAGEFVRAKITPPVVGERQGRWPGVRRWVNVRALGDSVVAEDPFDRWFPGVEDEHVDNGADAHRADPYLNADVTGAAIAAGIAGA
jgi:pimeloyl-ACP methyl ester carboxylesterase